MGDKTLKSKAIKIKGKDYVQVKDRILYFNENFKNGSIKTKIESDNEKEIIFKAIATPDEDKPERYYTGFAGGIRGGAGVDSTSAIENAETSAVGRALAMMGIGVLESVASADEVNKALGHSKTYSNDSRGTREPRGTTKDTTPSEAQMKYLKQLAWSQLKVETEAKWNEFVEIGKEVAPVLDLKSKKSVSEVIEKLASADEQYLEVVSNKLFGKLDW